MLCNCVCVDEPLVLPLFHLSGQGRQGEARQTCYVSERAMGTKCCCCIPFRRAGGPANDSTIGASQCQETPLTSTIVPTKSEGKSTIESNPGASQCQETPLSSTDVPLKSEGDSTVESGPGASQCQEIPLSSTNVPSKSEGEKVDVNPNTQGVPKCDEGSSSSSSVPIKSEGENVEANLNVPGASQTDKAASSSGPTKSDLTKTIKEKDIVADEGGNLNVNLDQLMEDISLLLKLIEEENGQHKKPTIPRKYWTYSSDWKKLYELLSSGVERLYALKDVISGPVKGILKGMGHASLATTGLLVIAYSLERYEELSSNKEECLRLLKEMYCVANVVKKLKQSPEGFGNVTEDATALLVEGAIMCCSQIPSSPWNKFFKSSKDKEDLSGMTQKLNLMYNKISVQIGLRVLTEIERKGKSPLSKGYPKHAVGIEESVKAVLDLLECESEEKAVTVILHGFGGMGKTTLADAVFSQIGGCEYSEVQLFTDIQSKPDIIDLQNKLLKDLMGPKATVPKIRKYQDGQRELEDVLEKVHAFIYIDNVLEGDALKKLLPQNMLTAKKVRLLLTARDEDVKIACPRSLTKIYSLKGIQSAAALRILKEEIKEGINDSQFNDILRICGEIPLMLTLAAAFIGRAEDKRKAYDRLMQDEGKWEHKSFKDIHCAFAYDAIPKNCKDPFLDICSYFKGWDWDTVADIVGQEVLESLASIALVTKDANGSASVHDVILSLACQKSKEESQGKEVRLKFTTKAQLEEFLVEKDTEGIKGIWVSADYIRRRNAVDISSSTLDTMHSSLRVLHLGHVKAVSGNCSKIFKKLVYFEAEITQFPFDVSKLEQLRYLCYKPTELKELPKMPSSLRHIEFGDYIDGMYASQFSSTYFQQLGHLRILRLNCCDNLKNLPEDLFLGDLVNGLQELSLYSWTHIEKLPESISRLQSLRILEIEYCSSLTKLPANIGLLSSLQELSLLWCTELVALPKSVENLSSLTLLNLNWCRNLKNLPDGLGNLTGLVKLSLDGVDRLESIPESIRELKLLQTTSLSMWTLKKELPHGFCNLRFLTRLSLAKCGLLKNLPEAFGQLASLRVVNLNGCATLKKLPQGFGQLKYLEELVLKYCYHLKELCNKFHCLSSLQNLDLSKCYSLDKLPEDFHCLSSLQNLDLSECYSLDKLPEDFHRLPSLQNLYLRSCKRLKGKWMDRVVNMKRLPLVHIEKSKQLLKRWAEIQRDSDPSWSFCVISGQALRMSEAQKENIQKNLLSDFDRLLTDVQGKPFHISHLPLNTLILLISAFPATYRSNLIFPWNLLEEMVDEIQTNFKIIYLGSNCDLLAVAEKVKNITLVGDLPGDRVHEVFEKVWSTSAEIEGRHGYFQLVGNGKSDEYRPCWKHLTATELEELVLDNCGKYIRLKKLLETTQNSTIELLTELFAPEAHQTTDVFQKNFQDCGVDELKGKTILLEIRHTNLAYDIRLQSLKEMYDVVEKEKLALEIISIPIYEPSRWKCTFEESEPVPDFEESGAYEQFLKEIPWLVFIERNSRKEVIRRVLFLAKKCGWKECDEYENWYPTLNLIIDPCGKVIIYNSSLMPIMGEVGKVLSNYFEGVSYQVRSRAKVCPIMDEKIEKLNKEEWKQLKNMSTLEFLFSHLERVSSEVKKIMFQKKIICLCSKMTYWLQYLLKKKDDIPIIYIHKYGVQNMERFQLTYDTYKYFYHPPRYGIAMPQALLNLWGNEALRFWMRILYLKAEINGMDESDEQLWKLKSFLQSFQFLLDKDKYTKYYGPFDEENDFMTFMNKDGKIIATCDGEIVNWISYDDRRGEREHLLKKLIKNLEKENETYGEDYSISHSLTKNIQTAVDASEQQNVDVDLDLDILSKYIHELLVEEQLYQFFKINKERKKWSQPKAIWPTSEGFRMLKDFLLKGINVNWVHDIISGNEEDKWKTVTKRLLKDIGQTQWAAAGLLIVADVLERFNTVSTNQNLCLFLLDEMYRMALYLKKKFNRLPTWMKREATGSIVIGSIMCCAQIDPSKFAMFIDKPVDEKVLRAFLAELKLKCDGMIRALSKGLKKCIYEAYEMDDIHEDHEAYEMDEIYQDPRGIFNVSADFVIGHLEGESEDEGGSSSEGESGDEGGSSFEGGNEDEDEEEGGSSSEGESGDEGGSSFEGGNEDEDEGGSSFESEDEDEGGSSSKGKGCPTVTIREEEEECVASSPNATHNNDDGQPNSTPSQIAS